MPSSCPLCTCDRPDPVFRYRRYPFYIKPVRREDLGKVPIKPLTILLCPRCGFIYQDMSCQAEELEKIYKEVYESYHSPARSGIGSSLAREFLGFMGNALDLDGKKILEIGCYDGYLLSLLRDTYGCEVTGCDPSPGAEIARELGIGVVKDFFSPELFRERYDCIILRGVLEHVGDPLNLLASAGEVLSDSGSLAIEVPNVEYSLKNGVIGDFFHEHLSYFTARSLERCMEWAGFAPCTLTDSGYYLRGTFRRAAGSRGDPGELQDKGEVEKNRSLFLEYNANIERLVRQLREILKPLEGFDIYLYGGGGHTIGLLGRTYEFLRPAGVIDGDPQKHGKYIPGFNVPVLSKEILSELDPERSVIIVSSRIFQDEIVEELHPFLGRGLRVITLYHNVLYVKPPISPDQNGFSPSK